MGVVVDFLIFILGLIAGVSCLRYSYQLTQLFGYNSLAEQYLGQGGTYSMWKLIGLLIIAGTLWYVFR